MKEELPQIVLFGDSLTQWGFVETTAGFGWVLEEKYAGKAKVVNEGQAGYTSTLLENDFKRIIERATEPGAPPTLLLTIFLGANDACIIRSQEEYVPLPRFEANLREFVETVLIEDNMPETKIVLITPPPMNFPDYEEDDDEDLGPAAAAAAAAARQNPKETRAYRTYLSKKRYGDKIMEIAQSYEETGRVAGLNYWKAMIDAGLDDQNRLGDEDAYDEERLPGCGLKWAKRFKKGYFTDGLHLGPLGYDVLSKGLLDLVLKKWPELEPESIKA
ncbi:SGNH hydrolase [Melanomma pulvis-pyrius CBS 109.77]|uniref:SGNH hydrolase n=1 Tax=Melanomma pulvis-pyrius CBS 109.77 TaxID=1314802 RepID=A0A6A6XJM2_9PLEO|nr:SGNH hydrolase [Melanomma pulvis-pyrius CBS 109.77]